MKVRCLLAGCVAMMLAGAGCTRQAGAGAESGAGVSEGFIVAGKSPANGALAAQTFSFAEAVDLSRVTNRAMIHPQFAMTPPDVEDALLFAVVRDEAKERTSPVVLRKVNGAWRVLEIALREPGGGAPAPREWAHAAVCAERHELFAILDDADADAASPQMTILHSMDGGMSWSTLAAVSKPAGDADYAAFAMSAAGSGRLSMYLDDAVGQLAQGYYHYVTADGGKTWTGPTREPDDTADADAQDEDTSLDEALQAFEPAATQ